MMDPLSITASIIAVLQLSAVVVGYIVDVKDASKGRNRILQEIISTTGAVSILQLRIEKDESQEWAATAKLINGKNGCLEQFRDALELLEKRLKPAKGLKKIGISTIWPFEKSEVKEVLDRIERLKGLLMLASQNDHITLSQAINTSIKSVQGTIEAFTSDQALNEALEWFLTTDPYDNHSKACEKRQTGTGNWLLEDSEAFRIWRDNVKQSLWLYGIPGCGKTVLCSSIIEHVKSLCAHPAKKGFAVAFFYFDFSDANKVDVHNLLRSIVAQLSKQRDTGHQEILKLYREYGKEKRKPPNSVLESCVQGLAQQFQGVYLIIDALDECKERAAMLGLLSRVLLNTEVNLLCTSRNEQDIQVGFGGMVKTEIAFPKQAVDADIQAYVQNLLLNDSILKSRPERLKSRIEEELTRGADGMFLWIECQLHTLRACQTRGSIEKALQSLPASLEQTYERILLNIPVKGGLREQALTILQWLAFSERPLQLTEVAEAVAVRPGSQLTLEELDENRLFNPEDIFNTCRSLITVSVESGDDLKLSHKSVRDYLTSENIKYGPTAYFSIESVAANRAISEACLRYLLLFDSTPSDEAPLKAGFDNQYSHDSVDPERNSLGTLAEPPPEDEKCWACVLDNHKGVDPVQLEIYPLLTYAAEFWFEHVRRSGGDEHGTVLELALQLFDLSNGSIPTNSFVNWLRVFDPDGIHWMKRWKPESFGSPLYYASFLGLTKVAERLITKCDVNITGGSRGNALNAATFGNHQSLVLFLLDHGARIEAAGEGGNTALHYAAKMGHIGLVELLLKNGADVNLKNKFGMNETALEDCVAWFSFSVLHSPGDFETKVVPIIHMLVKGGADVDESLRSAAFSRSVPLVQLLIDLAPPNAVAGKAGHDLLCNAVCGGSVGVATLLLEKGADVNACSDCDLTALHCAAWIGHEKVVETFLRYGADVEAVTWRGETPLMYAARRGHTLTAKILLDHGANVEACDDGGGTALHAAVFENKESVIRILLEKGANINYKNMDGRTVLHCVTCRTSDLGILSWLLDKGADPNAKDEHDSTPLISAAYAGDEAGVTLLLDWKADPNAKTIDGMTAMHVAAQCQKDGVLCLLATHKADINAKDIKGASPIHCAARNGHSDTVKLLIGLSVDVSATDGKGRTALHYAVKDQRDWSSRNESVISLLLEPDATLATVKDLEGMTPLQTAAQSGIGKAVLSLLRLGVDGEGKTEKEWMALTGEASDTSIW